MKGLLVHVGADTSNLGVVGPVFQDASFEFLPVDNSYGIEKRTYSDFAARNIRFGQKLGDYLPSDKANAPVHFDPDFDNCTYGQHGGAYPRVQTLRKLAEGDALFFFASLASYDSSVYEHKDTLLRNYQLGKKNKYVIGVFTVQGVADVWILKTTLPLAFALLNVMFLEEEGKAPLEMRDYKEELEILKEYGFITKDGGSYRLTRHEEGGARSGQEIAQVISDLWPEDEASQRTLLEKGLMSFNVLSGNVTEDDVRLNHHYQRLRPLDFDYFVIIKGDPNRSCILTHAIRLTDRFEGFGFRLNKLGQSIIRKASDSMRGARWINEDAVSILVNEITETNDLVGSKLQHLT